jgi:type VI secretion system Hcp family effector
MAPKPVSTVSPPSFYGDVNMRGFNTVLTIDGIEGFSQFCEKGIDVVSFNLTFGTENAGQSKSGGLASSRVAFDGVIIRKSIDKASPLLFKALAERQRIANAGIHLFRDPPDGGKTSEHFFTISLGDVFVSRQVLVDPEGSEGGGVPYEEVTLSANSIEFNHIKAKKVAGIMLTQGAH